MVMTCIVIRVRPSRAVSFFLWSMLTVGAVSGRYFSFPSFDLYEANQQDEEKETEKSP